MNNFFKKTLVASAVLAFAGTASAVSTLQVPVDYSKQGITQAATVAPADVVITLGAEYAVGDIIDITFPGGTFANNNAPTYALSAAALEVGVLSVGSNSIRLRVTQQATATTVGSTLTISGLSFTSSSILASGALGVTFAAQTSTGLALDNDAGSTPSGNLIILKDQFTTAVTPFNAVIDVASDRLLFEGTGVTARTDALVISPTNAAATQQTSATLTTIDYEVAGDFSFLDQDANGVVSTTELNAAAITGGDSITAKALSSDLSTLTFRDTPAVPGTPAAVTLTATIATGTDVSDVVLTPTDFTATASFNYTSPNASFDVVKSGGSFTLNGSQVRVPYMVVGGDRFGIIANVANHGSKDGGITLDVFAEDGSVIASNYSAGTSVAGSVTSVAGPLNAALSAAGISTASPVKFSFQIVTNVPENDVTVYAAYTDNTTSERAVVNSDMKVQTKP